MRVTLTELCCADSGGATTLLVLKKKRRKKQFEFTCGWTTHLFKAFHNLMGLTEHIENIIFKVKLIYSPSSCFLDYFHFLTKVPLLDNREMFH